MTTWLVIELIERNVLKKFYPNECMISFFLPLFFINSALGLTQYIKARFMPTWLWPFVLFQAPKPASKHLLAFSDKRMKISTHFGKNIGAWKFQSYQIGHILCIYWLPKELPPIPQWPKSLDRWDGIIQWNL